MISDSQNNPNKKGLFAGVISDILLVVNHNKTFLIVMAAVVFVGLPLAALWRSYRLELDQYLFYNDPGLTIVEGENIRASNSEYWLDDEKGCFLNKYLILYTKDLPDQGYIFFRYLLNVEQSGDYKIFLAGSPPGAREKGFNIYYCPFEFWLDNKKAGDFYEEAYKAYLRQATGNDFYYFYEYTPGFRFTKLGEFYLSKGKHRLEFRISKMPLDYYEYKFKIDAVFLVPQEWKPKSKPFSLPTDLFSY